MYVNFFFLNCVLLNVYQMTNHFIHINPLSFLQMTTNLHSDLTAGKYNQ